MSTTCQPIWNTKNRTTNLKKHEQNIDKKLCIIKIYLPKLGLDIFPNDWPVGVLLIWASFFLSWANFESFFNGFFSLDLLDLKFITLVQTFW